MTAVSSRTIDKTFYIFCTPRKSYLHSFSKFNYKGLFDGCGLLIFVHFFFLPSIQISWWEVTFEDLSIKRQTYFAFFREKQFAIFFKTAFGYKSRNRKIQSMKEKKNVFQIFLTVFQNYVFPWCQQNYFWWWRRQNSVRNLRENSECSNGRTSADLRKCYASNL